MSCFRVLSFALLAATLVAPATSDACTTFCGGDEGSPIIGKSYDWHMGQGLVVFNKKGVAKRAIPGRRGDRPASWTSRFASLTFNQYGVEFPNGGMNTAGLVVEVMWLNGSAYPEVDERPSLTELQWIQYQLDNFATTREVVAAAPKLRVSPVYAKVHYLVCDKGARCAAFEYVDGSLRISHGKGLPTRTLTNHTYADSKTHLAKYSGFGGSRGLPGGRGSLSRFVRAASTAATATDHKAAFAVLDRVSQGDYSKWNIVYDPTRRRIWFRTTRARAIKAVHMDDFDPSCKTAARMLDIDHAEAGLVSKRFAAFDSNRNIDLLKKSLGPIISELPRGSFTELAAYPTLLKCAAP